MNLFSYASGNAFLRVIVVLILSITTVLAFKLTSSVNSTTESGVNMTLPSRVNGFSGKDAVASEGEKYVLPKDTEIVKMIYSDSFGDPINAQVVLAGAEKRSIHRPELCLPAQGWSIDRRETIPVRLADGRSITVMADHISRPVEISPGVMKTLPSLYCYWFVGNGVSTSSHLHRLLLTSWDRVIHHKNHRWAYIAVSAPVLQGFMPNGKDAKATQKMIIDFIAALAPSVMK
jgi:hypothetical protein